MKSEVQEPLDTDILEYMIEIASTADTSGSDRHCCAEVQRGVCIRSGYPGEGKSGRSVDHTGYGGQQLAGADVES